jgi:hypothetical protein
MKVESSLWRITPAHFPERARLYRLTAGSPTLGAT